MSSWADRARGRMGERPQSVRNAGLGYAQAAAPATQTAPTEVDAVYELMVESGEAAGSPRARSLVTQGKGEWALSDDYGNVGTVLIYNGEWWIKLPNVTVRRIPGGYQGARQFGMDFYDSPLGP
ncbi:MAG: hypothetical protein GY772_29230 [bacterium]|nr:hypothetical protein [bacterium]